jgi:hypothetical protein
MVDFISTWWSRSKAKRGFGSYWQLLEENRANGVYEDVLVDILPSKSTPMYDYDLGSQVALFSESGDLVVYTLRLRRILVPLRNVPYEEEALHLKRLRESLPDADEYRVLWTTNGSEAQRGYWAVKYPR